MSAPLCRYCGVEIAKYTKTIYFRDRELHSYEREPHHGFGYIQVSEFPKDKAEAQRLINSGTIVSVRRSGDHISYVSVWDGHSYKDDYFCSGDHARLFGYAAARKGGVMAAWQEAYKAQQIKETTP